MHISEKLLALDAKDYRDQCEEVIQLPRIDDYHFMQEWYLIPAIKVGEDMYVLICNATNIGRNSTVENYQGFSIVNMELLQTIQYYHYQRAKRKHHRSELLRRKKFAMRKRSTMMHVQYHLLRHFYGEKANIRKLHLDYLNDWNMYERMNRK